MSKLAKLGVTSCRDGQVIVNFGGSGRGFELVTHNESRDIGLLSEEAAEVGFAAGLGPLWRQSAHAPSPSGAIGGAVALNTRILRPVRVGLDHLARTFRCRGQPDTPQRPRCQRGAWGRFISDYRDVHGYNRYCLGCDYCECQGDRHRFCADGSSRADLSPELRYLERPRPFDARADWRDRFRREPASAGDEFFLTGAPDNGDVVIFSPTDRPARTFEAMVTI